MRRSGYLYPHTSSRPLLSLSLLASLLLSRIIPVRSLQTFLAVRCIALRTWKLASCGTAPAIRSSRSFPRTPMSHWTANEGDSMPDPSLRLWDAHNHLHLTPDSRDLLDLLQPEEDQVCLSLMGTRVSDWSAIADLAAQHASKLVPSFGFHPWWAHERVEEDWKQELRRLLHQHPSACVGEIGLDGQWIPPGLDSVQYEKQKEVFQAQLEIATEMSRPVSLHCVKAYGDMFDMLRFSDELPPAIYMHSFGGKVGMLNSFVKMKKYGDRFYFGFSSFTNLRSPKTSQVIASVPDDKLLLESDLEDAKEVHGALLRMLQVIADAKGWTLDYAAKKTWENAETFYSKT